MCYISLSKFDLRNKADCNISKRRKLKKIFKELANRCANIYIDRDQFLRFTELPGLLGEQTFNALDEDEDNKLEAKEFVIGISTLYSGNLNTVTDFLFKLLNFSRNGQITKIEVKYILEYLPETCRKCKATLKPDWDLDEKINSLFGNEKYLLYGDFHDRIIDKNEIGELLLGSIISLMPEVFDSIFVSKHQGKASIEGFLNFRGRKYYAKLQNKAIFYSISENSSAKGIILVNDLFLEKSENFSFLLKNSKFCYEFRTDNQEIQERWIETLKIAIDFK